MQGEKEMKGKVSTPIEGEVTTGGRTDRPSLIEAYRVPYAKYMELIRSNETDR